MKIFFAIFLLIIPPLCFANNITLNLTAVYDAQKKAVKLKWQNNETGIHTFILQRSADNNKWSDLYKIDSDELSSRKIEKFTDIHPDPAKNYYRLKLVVDQDHIEFSASIMIIIGEPQNSWIMYPVPVTSVLNLQYTGSDLITGVISVFIQNTQGRILTRLRYSSLNRTIEIPVTNLGRGIYDVRIMIMDKIVWNQRFLK